MIKESIIRHEHGKWVVRTHDASRILGTHDTRQEAEKQLYAIEVNKKKSFNSRTANTVEHARLGPCRGKDCDTCAHFDELLEDNVATEGKPLTTKQKNHNKKIQEMKKRHKSLRKSAAVTPDSLRDFHNWMPTGWRMAHHGSASDRWDPDSDATSRHDVVILHHPETGNRVKLYDHSNFDPSATINHWNVHAYAEPIAAMMRHMSRHGLNNITLDLTRDRDRPNKYSQLGDEGTTTATGTSAFTRPSESVIYMTNPANLGSSQVDLETHELVPRIQKNVSESTLPPTHFNWNSTPSSGLDAIRANMDHEIGHLKASGGGGGGDVVSSTSREQLDLMSRVMDSSPKMALSALLDRQLRERPPRVNNHNVPLVATHLTHPNIKYLPLEEIEGDHLHDDYEESRQALTSGKLHRTNSTPFFFRPVPLNSGRLAITDTPGSSVMAGLAMFSPSRYGTTNLQEHFAEHYAAWVNPHGKPNRFTALMADHFGWENPQAHKVIKDPSQVLSDQQGQ